MVCWRPHLAGTRQYFLFFFFFNFVPFVHKAYGLFFSQQENVIPVLLKAMSKSQDQATIDHARQALAMVGYAFPVKGNGIRILSIDGGGTRYVTCLMIYEKLIGFLLHLAVSLQSKHTSNRNTPLSDIDHLTNLTL